MAQEDSNRPGRRKVRKGVVVSNKMKDTVVVRVDSVCLHPKYGKVVTRTKRYYAHDAGNQHQMGQQVTIMETRPLSKLKRWRVVEA